MTRNWLKNAALLGAGCLAAFLLLEVFIAFYPPLQPRVRGGHIVLFPHKSYLIENDKFPKLDKVITRSNNSLGLRGPEPPENFAEVLTVIALGGSTTEGFYLSDGKTWPERFGARLDGAFRGSWVNNAGMDGHSTFGHSVLMSEYIVKLRPKAVLLLTGLNDMGKASPDRFDLQLTGHGGRSLPARLFIYGARHSRVLALAQNAILHARAIKAGVGHGELDLRDAARARLPEGKLAELRTRHEPLAGAYALRLAAIADQAREAGIEPFFITQPMLCGEGKDPATGEDLETLADTPEYVNCRGRWRTLEIYNDAMRRFAAEKKVRICDLARKMPKDSRYYYDSVHFTAEGADMVGAIVYADLCRALSGLSPGTFTGCGERG